MSCYISTLVYHATPVRNIGLPHWYKHSELMISFDFSVVSCNDTLNEGHSARHTPTVLAYRDVLKI
jgi:hypothetical protein